MSKEIKDKAIQFSLKFSSHDSDFKGENPNTSWVKILPLDEVIQYGDSEITFNMTYLREIVSQTTNLNNHFDDVANGTPYRMPVWQDHQRSHDRDGSVLEVKMANRDGFTGVWAKIERTKDTQLALDEGRLGYVSAGISPEYVTQDGQKFGPIIREISLTADPFLKNIGSIQDTYEVELSKTNYANLASGETMNPKEKKEQLDALEKALKATPEMAEILAELQALMKKVQEQQKENAKELDLAEDNTEDVEPVEPALSTTDDTEIVTLSQISDLVTSLIKPLQDDLKSLNMVPKRVLNLHERGTQGEPEQVLEFANYGDKIEHLMKTNKCSRLEALDIEMNS